MTRQKLTCQFLAGKQHPSWEGALVVVGRLLAWTDRAGLVIRPQVLEASLLEGEVAEGRCRGPTLSSSWLFSAMASNRIGKRCGLA
ncbi:MAG: hypothetical protein AB8B70_09350, partial [Prochlorococcus sp.]